MLQSLDKSAHDIWTRTNTSYMSLPHTPDSNHTMPWSPTKNLIYGQQLGNLCKPTAAPFSAAYTAAADASAANEGGEGTPIGAYRTYNPGDCNQGYKPSYRYQFYMQYTKSGAPIEQTRVPTTRPSKKRCPFYAFGAMRYPRPHGLHLTVFRVSHR